MRRRGSFEKAGLVTGGLALGAAFGAPLAVRLVDRWGPRTLMPLACGHAVALLGLVGLGEAGAPAAGLAGVALAGGACFPPSGSVLRARFPELLSGDVELIRGAYALDSVTIEASFVSGPLITAAAVALTGPEAAIVLSAALVIAGAAAFNAALPDPLAAPRERPAHHTRLLGALADPGVRLIALCTVPIGSCRGSVEVAIPAFSAEEGSAELSGILPAVWSLASGVGGFVFGARRTRGDRRHLPLDRADLPARLRAARGGRLAACDGRIGRARRRADRADDRERQRARRRRDIR